ncbi:MAG: OmpA family protein [Lysobacteraceae bacterium]
MNKKLLCAALLCGLGVAQAASAQTFDDRWYVTGSAGMNMQDNDRLTDNAPFLAVGVGKYLTQHWSIDAELNYQNPNFNNNAVCLTGPTEGFCNPHDLNWSQYGISFDARYHFLNEGRNWNPYLLMGLGYQRSEEELDNFPNPDSPAVRKHGNIAGKLGLGVEGKLGSSARVRGEVAYRIDADNNSRAGLLSDPDNDDGPDWFGDVLASVGVVIPLGPEPTAPVAPAPAAPSCADMDSDGDGVNDCNDKCPGSQAGQTIGPDGCPVPVSIDLKGVNFDFDKSQLRPDAVEILNQAVEILKRYPDLKVEVAGHTDSVGTDAYNQKLSERRAKAVYDYLTSNGVDASRLIGPTGYGESRPIAPNTNPDGSDNPEGRAQNRRTELNVQNQ